MKALRLLIPATLAVALVPFAAAPALAAPPANDVPGGALVLHRGDRVTQDTTEATTDAADEALNENCGAPATNASVWYQFTPAKDRKVVLDATHSSYSTGVMVFKGLPTPDSLLTCGPDAAALRAKAGKTYYFMVFSVTPVNGGTLDMRFTKAFPPHVRVSLAKRGVAFHGGAAQIHGAYFCEHGESFAFTDAHLFQRAGRLKIQADSDNRIRCNGKRHHWSARLVSPVGTFARGRAAARVTIIACGYLECRQAVAKRHVRLAWASGPRRQPTIHPSTARTAHPRPLFPRERHWPGS
jgi:hypothetical protein